MTPRHQRADVPPPLLAAAAGLGGFALAVVLAHVLVPELEPASHMVSEYANSDAGTVMTVGFVGWAVSLAATILLTVRLAKRSRPLAWRSLGVLLGLAAAGVLLAAAFKTQAVAGRLPEGVAIDAGGRLHDLGSGVAQLALFSAAAVSARAVEVPAFRRFVLGALALGVASSVVLLAIGDEVGGLRQRVLIAIACLWQARLLATVRAVSPRD